MIGAGIVGLSFAMQAVRDLPGLRLLILEKEEGVARHQSSHNSGVVHSGVYYQPGSLKAKLCVEGARAMAEFCHEHSIPYARCGKLIVATREQEVPRLDDLWQRGQANGLIGLRLLDPTEMKEIEPACRGLRALWVPATGITDYAQVSAKYAELAMAQGATLVTGARVTGFRQDGSQVTVLTTRRNFATRAVVNCAGLYSDRIARLAGHQPDVLIVPFRGEYYDLIPERESLVRGLIYPVPDPRFPFLGVHLTRRVHGGVDAGPNAVFAFDREGYQRSDFNAQDVLESVGSAGFRRLALRNWRYGVGEFGRSLSKSAFLRSLQRLVPELKPADLRPGGAGVRAQAIRPDGSLVDDFNFLPCGRFLHILNCPSPAATASLPIGREILNMAREVHILSR